MVCEKLELITPIASIESQSAPAIFNRSKEYKFTYNKSKGQEEGGRGGGLEIVIEENETILWIKKT